MNVILRQLCAWLLTAVVLSGGSACALAKPILFVLSEPNCAPCQRFDNSWHTNDAFRNALHRSFDVRGLPRAQWLPAYFRLSKPAYIIEDAPFRRREPVIGFTSMRDLLERLGVTVPAELLPAPSPVQQAEPRPSKLDKLHPREYPDWIPPADSRQRPPTIPATVPAGREPVVREPVRRPDISDEIFREVPESEWRDVPPAVESRPAEPPSEQQAKTGEKSLIGTGLNWALTAATTYAEVKYGVPFAIASGAVGWLIGRRRKRGRTDVRPASSRGSPRQRDFAGDADTFDSPAAERVRTVERVPKQMLAELELLRAEREKLREQLAESEQSINYVTPDKDDRLESFRRAMSRISAHYPNARTWVQMFEEAYKQERGGELKSA